MKRIVLSLNFSKARWEIITDRGLETLFLKEKSNMKKAFVSALTLALAATLAMPVFAKSPKAAKAQDASAQTSGKKHHKVKHAKTAKKSKTSKASASGASTTSQQ